jgi:hypothetical protein
METKLFLEDVRDAVVRFVGQRGDELQTHAVEDEQSVSEIRPPGGL